MNNLPRQKLSELIEKYGTALCDEPKRCEGFLRDICGKYRREISALIGALEQGVVADLLAVPDNVAPQLLMGRLVQRLQDNLALAHDAAVWAVESWALALGIISTPQESLVLPDSSPEMVDSRTDAASTTRYILNLTIGSNPPKTWQYSVELVEWYEDNPEKFFTDASRWERQRLEAALQGLLGRNVSNSELNKILQSWCQQIALGYRNAYLDI